VASSDLDLSVYIKHLLRSSVAWDAFQRVKDRSRVALWEKAGKPEPPPHVIKRDILLSHATMYKCPILIESGTYLGDMIYAMRDRFQTIVSIELSNDLAKRAKRRFRAYPHIQILSGDSGEVLPQILSNISTPCLLWLDGHYSGGVTAIGRAETPVMKELMTILRHEVKHHVILVDDARCFNGTKGYPTIDELKALITQNGPSYDLSIANDVIQIRPRKAA